MMNTKAIGDGTTAMVLARLAVKGKSVLLPYGDKDRFDLVLFEDNHFHRIQCKTGRLKNGTVRFATSSVYSHSKGSAVVRSYGGEVDYFGVYCPELDKTYLVPIGAASTKRVRWMPVEEIEQYLI